MKYQFTQKALDRKQELIKEFERQVKASLKERKRLYKICVDEVPLFEQLLEIDTEKEPHKIIDKYLNILTSVSIGVLLEYNTYLDNTKIK